MEIKNSSYLASANLGNIEAMFQVGMSENIHETLNGIKKRTDKDIGTENYKLNCSLDENVQHMTVLGFEFYNYEEIRLPILSKLGWSS
ncbi:9028_t:CDS:2 [Ambispora gerdemannii]|uniref:9028_t:CDS:1 n=1 Tax=Ambispora gerdemannii TaxID=144530 RepID=A0A9N8Z8U6_9GLOM|nr:9028_t:CDS:2 [Ambispora gerdemannii]